MRKMEKYAYQILSANVMFYIKRSITRPVDELLI